eukprot:UN25005
MKLGTQQSKQSYYHSQNSFMNAQPDNQQPIRPSRTIWNCPRCTFANKGLSNVCELCLCQKPVMSGQWTCPFCTMLNAATSQNCEMCRKQKGSTGAKTQPQPVVQKPKRHSQGPMKRPPDYFGVNTNHVNHHFSNNNSRKSKSSSVLVTNNVQNQKPLPIRPGPNQGNNSVGRLNSNVQQLPVITQHSSEPNSNIQNQPKVIPYNRQSNSQPVTVGPHKNDSGKKQQMTVSPLPVKSQKQPPKRGAIPQKAKFENNFDSNR